jgi:D-glycero-D-manno-heptose 1,7-bisphosphate phosphatase
MPGPAIFVDRDGVINRDRSDYVKSWGEFEFLPGSIEAFRVAAGRPFRVVVVTNQSAVGRGLVSREEVETIHRRMAQAIRAAGGRIDAVYVCPHRPEDGCECRKPKPGLILRAARDLGLDLKGSLLIGDDRKDLESAVAAGVRPVLVRTGHGARLPDAEIEALGVPVSVFEDLLSALNSLPEPDPESRS